ncbi:MAG: BspA family leucine-rich repeat surface protein [Candidatus Methanofishera endochildressiae]|uniref:BspA family leucine-rich repeat surface protein n=1 Tax=Candidatus Methanofishera endochildressiae TaxID=2738884 RepID=A0A7Z0MML0_9GAMM|nr:BspA family leucine-rich repeat surface protein [Candidatus Methanofishera endochildressiae]
MDAIQLEHLIEAQVPFTRDQLESAIGLGVDLTHIDTSKIKSMKKLFSKVQHFKGTITDWDTSNVTTMASMFHRSSFNQPLNWDTSQVTNMAGMFQWSKFNQP